MKAKIFISYSYEDEAIAQRLISSLSQQHIDISNLDALLVSEADLVMQNIRKQIEVAKALIVLFFKHSQNSSWVAFELGIAMALGVNIIPVLITRAQDNIPAYLKQLPIHYEGPELYKELQRLISAPS